MKTDSPQVKALLLKVSEIYGKPIKTPSDFLEVADKIEQETREHISDSTIKRLYVPKLGYDSVMERTLDVLAKYIGFAHFEAFCSYLQEKDHSESHLFKGGDGVRAEEMSSGSCVKISWLPDRECELKYLGECRWEVLSSKNASINSGDTFSCSAIYKGRPLYMDDLNHNGENYASYAMGLRHGICYVEIL